MTELEQKWQAWKAARASGQIRDREFPGAEELLKQRKNGAGK